MGDEVTTESGAGMSTGWTIVAACLFVGVSLGVGVFMLAPIFVLEIPDRALSGDEIDAVFTALRNPLLTERSAEDLVESYGWGALPFLIAVIGDEGETVRVRGQSCLVAGKFRDGTATVAIRKFLEGVIGAEMTKAAVAAAAMGFDGYGFCGTDDGLKDLEAMAGLGYWARDGRQGPTRAGDDARGGLDRLFRERAVRALSLAPGGGGIGALKRLREVSPELDEACDGALTTARRRRWGVDRLGEL